MQLIRSNAISATYKNIQAVCCKGATKMQTPELSDYKSAYEPGSGKKYTEEIQILLCILIHEYIHTL